MAIDESDIKFQTNYLPHIQNNLASGSFLLFTGAGFSYGAKSTTGKALPLASDMAKELWDICYPSDAYDNSSSLQDVFEVAMLEQTKSLQQYLQDPFAVNHDSITDFQLHLLNALRRPLSWPFLGGLSIKA